MSDLASRVRSVIRDVPDFPKDGILFKDIMPVLAQPALVNEIVDWMAETWGDQGIDRIVGMESRGFLFGMPLAAKMGIGFAPARKPGKLPWKTLSESYELEYGTNTLEMHQDAVEAGHRVLVVDDLLATGGTARATVDLIRRLGGEVVGTTFLIELGFLPGREALGEGVRVESLITY